MKNLLKNLIKPRFSLLFVVLFFLALLIIFAIQLLIMLIRYMQRFRTINIKQAYKICKEARDKKKPEMSLLNGAADIPFEDLVIRDYRRKATRTC